MVQFNLLPDVKLEFYRTQKTKRIVFGLAFLVVGISVGLFLISFIAVDIVQSQLLKKADNDITTYNSQLKKIPDIEKILTVQNQLQDLPALHNKKHITSRVFTYLPQVVPSNVNVSRLTIDTATNTMQIDGTADKVESVNKFVDTLKFTAYSIKDKDGFHQAFTNVVLTNIGRNQKNTSYTVKMSYNPSLYDYNSQVTLTVPKEPTTRSVTETPGVNSTLFNGETKTDQTQNKQGQ